MYRNAMQMKGDFMEERLKRIYIPMTETGFYILFCLQEEMHGYNVGKRVSIQRPKTKDGIPTAIQAANKVICFHIGGHFSQDSFFFNSQYVVCAPMIKTNGLANDGRASNK